MKNKHPGPCRACNETVEVGAGVYEKNPAGGRGWNLHRRCATRARLASGGSSILSAAQLASLQDLKP